MVGPCPSRTLHSPSQSLPWSDPTALNRGAANKLGANRLGLRAPAVARIARSVGVGLPDASDGDFQWQNWLSQRLGIVVPTARPPQPVYAVRGLVKGSAFDVPIGSANCGHECAQ